MRIQSAIT